MTTLKVELDLLRVAHQARRVEAVLAVLPQQRRRAESSTVPKGLDESIAWFSLRLADLRARMAELAAGQEGLAG